MLEIKGLHFSYGSEELFTDLNLSFKSGIYGLLGENGAGKTTLMKLALGLLFPKNGEVYINSKLSSKREPCVLSDLFFIPEAFSLDDIKASSYRKMYGGFYPSFSDNTFNRLLDDFSVDKNGILTKMSFGQQKKFLLSFALATNVSLLIFDEPSNGMDIPSKTLMRKHLKEMASQNKTFIISTHQVRDLEDIFERIAILHKGSLIFEKSMKEIKECLSLNGKGKTVFSDSSDKKITIRKNNLEEAVEAEMIFNAVLNNIENINEAFSGENR